MNAAYAYLDTSAIPLIAESAQATERLDSRYRVCVSFEILWEIRRIKDHAKRREILRWLCERDPLWLRDLKESIQYEIYTKLCNTVLPSLGQITDPYWAVEDYRVTSPGPMRWARPTKKLPPAELLDRILKELAELEAQPDNFDRWNRGHEFIHQVRLEERSALLSDETGRRFTKDGPWWRGLDEKELQQFLLPRIKRSSYSYLGYDETRVTIADDLAFAAFNASPTFQALLSAQILMLQRDTRKQAEKNVARNDLLDMLHLAILPMVDLFVTDDRQMLDRANVLLEPDSPIRIRPRAAKPCLPGELVASSP